MSWLIHFFTPYYQLRHALTPSFDILLLVGLIYFVMTFYTAWMISGPDRVKKEKYGTEGWGQTFWVTVFVMAIIVPFGIWFVSLVLPFAVFIIAILFVTHVPVQSIVKKQSPLATLKGMFWKKS